jgi:hypothetical protein
VLPLSLITPPSSRRGVRQRRRSGAGGEGRGMLTTAHIPFEALLSTYPDRSTTDEPEIVHVSGLRATVEAPCTQRMSSCRAAEMLRAPRTRAAATDRVHGQRGDTVLSCTPPYPTPKSHLLDLPAMTSPSVSWSAYDQLGHPSASEDRRVCGGTP